VAGNSGKVHEVKYEAILEEPEREVFKLYEFLGEDYSKQNIQEMAKKTKKGNSNKWKKNMKERDIRIFENVAANTLETEGYETGYKEEQVSLDKILYYELHNQIKHISHFIKINTGDTIAIKFLNKEPFNQ
jgi:hypothetical protein